MNDTNYGVPHCGAFSTSHFYPTWAKIFASGSCFQIPKWNRKIKLRQILLWDWEWKMSALRECKQNRIFPEKNQQVEGKINWFPFNWRVPFNWWSFDKPSLRPRHNLNQMKRIIGWWRKGCNEISNSGHKDIPGFDLSTVKTSWSALEIE